MTKRRKRGTKAGGPTVRTGSGTPPADKPSAPPTPGTPTSIAARNGSRSRWRSSGSPRPTLAGPSSVDRSAAPSPGKCLTALKSRCSR